MGSLLPVSEPDLYDLRTGQSLGAYAREMWERRQFAIVVPASDIRLQNMDTALGQFWHILNPALLVSVYYLIFGVILEADRGVDNYLGFLVVGILVFQLTQRVVQDAANVMVRNEGLIRSIQFPRALLPVATANGQTFAFLPALLVLFVTLLLTGERPALRWLLFPLVLALQYVFNLGGALLVARVGHGARDLFQVLPHLFRILFYLSGVLFSVDVLVDDELVRRLFALNPLYDIVALARFALLGISVPGEVVAASFAWTIVTAVAGVVLFRRAEHRYGG